LPGTNPGGVLLPKSWSRKREKASYQRDKQDFIKGALHEKSEKRRNAEEAANLGPGEGWW